MCNVPQERGGYEGVLFRSRNGCGVLLRRYVLGILETPARIARGLPEASSNSYKSTALLHLVTRRRSPVASVREGRVRVWQR